MEIEFEDKDIGVVWGSRWGSHWGAAEGPSYHRASYHRAVMTGTVAFMSYKSWLQEQLSASNLALGQPVAPGGDKLERKNHCQGLKEMEVANSSANPRTGTSTRACSAMARRLPVGAHNLTDGAAAGIGAIIRWSSKRGCQKTLVLCSIWVDPSHRRQGLWQRLLLDLLDEIEPHVLELGSGLVTAFACNQNLRRCLVTGIDRLERRRHFTRLSGVL